MANEPETLDEDELEPEHEWDYDEDQGRVGNASAAIGTFVDDMFSEEVETPAFDAYVPIKVPDPDASQDEAPVIYFEPPRPATAAEHHARVPKLARGKFWSYRHEFYEQAEYIVSRFAHTELGLTWLCEQGWCFPLIKFADATPTPRTNMGLRLLTRREAAAHYAKLDVIVTSELNKHAAWRDDLGRCTLALLGDSSAHVLRMAAVLLDDDPSAVEATLYRNAQSKALTFLREEEATLADSDWAIDALKAYSI